MSNGQNVKLSEDSFVGNWNPEQLMLEADPVLDILDKDYSEQDQSITKETDEIGTDISALPIDKRDYGLPSNLYELLKLKSDKDGDPKSTEDNKRPPPKATKDNFPPATITWFNHYRAMKPPPKPHDTATEPWVKEVDYISTNDTDGTKARKKKIVPCTFTEPEQLHSQMDKVRRYASIKDEYERTGRAEVMRDRVKGVEWARKEGCK